jgi:hypothetical protein
VSNTIWHYWQVDEGGKSPLMKGNGIIDLIFDEKCDQKQNKIILKDKNCKFLKNLKITTFMDSNFAIWFN